MLTARAVLLAVVAVLLGVAGHVATGGGRPAPAVLVLLVAGAVVLGLRLLRDPAGPTRIVALLGVMQLGTYAVVRLTSGAGAAPDAGRRLGSPLDHYAASVGTAAAPPTLPADQGVTDLRAHLVVVAAHLVVAIAVGLWLAVGERCLFGLLSLLAAVATRLLVPVLLAPTAAPPAERSARRVVRRQPRRLLLARSVSRRGPPVLLAC